MQYCITTLLLILLICSCGSDDSNPVNNKPNVQDTTKQNTVELDTIRQDTIMLDSARLDHIFIDHYPVNPNIKYRIMYRGLDSNNLSQLFTMNPDGSDIRQVTISGVDDGMAAVSPDTKKIVFGSRIISVIDISGGNSTPLINTGSGLQTLSWSRDRRIYYDPNPARSGVRYINPNGSASEMFYRRAYSPAPSPTGKFVAVLGFSSGGSPAIQLVTRDTAYKKTLSLNLEYLTGLDISPDGNWLAFTAAKSGWNGRSIYVMDIRGKWLTELPTGRQYNFGPIWTPDGKHIIFYGEGDGICIMDRDGKNVRRIQNGQNKSAVDCYPVTDEK